MIVRVWWPWHHQNMLSFLNMLLYLPRFHEGTTLLLPWTPTTAPPTASPPIHHAGTRIQGTGARHDFHTRHQTWLETCCPNILGVRRLPITLADSFLMNRYSNHKKYVEHLCLFVYLIKIFISLDHFDELIPTHLENIPMLVHLSTWYLRLLKVVVV